MSNKYPELPTIVNIGIEQTEPHKCVKCKNEIFQLIYFIRVIPALLSPTLREERTPIQAFQCQRCKTVAELNPKKDQNIHKLE